ncbi:MULTISPECIES: hypothetical protein [Pseudoxanthomonas]|jgi:hypothetical protein|uniref:hypothetical protein n=1 Tax=Pseudoxanthomonas TaxID=83618 RepID=UPI00178485C2|nr:MULTISPECIES: hypothetical protein [Pseudoxanthomonas]MBD9375998.1 hypothetical protein [Pseudoxanthomonas sp. PXM04]UBB25997.1 hypothetical protein LAG73_02605 [Pseudoxanthomonas japonensis]
MDGRPHALSLALVLMTTGLAASAALADERAPVTIEVRGDDFPMLVQDTGLPPPLDDNGLPRTPGCEAVRARRVDELPYPWREAVDRIHLDCQPMEAPEGETALMALTATAFLKPGRVWLAGHTVSEIRRMDSELWGDHQYVLAEPYAQVAADLRAQLEADCVKRHTRQEREGAPECTMEESEGALYLRVDEISGIWIHADPDDASRTIYAEGWAD